MQGEACLGVETLCDFEVQGFHTRATRVDGGMMSLEAGADELTKAGVVTAATAGMVHTNGEGLNPAGSLGSPGAVPFHVSTGGVIFFTPFCFVF